MKRITSIILIGLFLAGVLAGCGEKSIGEPATFVDGVEGYIVPNYKKLEKKMNEVNGTKIAFEGTVIGLGMESLSNAHGRQGNTENNWCYLNITDKDDNVWEVYFYTEAAIDEVEPLVGRTFYIYAEYLNFGMDVVRVECYAPEEGLYDVNTGQQFIAGDFSRDEIDTHGEGITYGVLFTRMVEFENSGKVEFEIRELYEDSSLFIYSTIHTSDVTAESAVAYMNTIFAAVEKLGINELMLSLESDDQLTGMAHTDSGKVNFLIPFPDEYIAILSVESLVFSAMKENKKDCIMLAEAIEEYKPSSGIADWVEAMSK